ncbi:hypothetical protein C5167_046549 [Papaver somniferum]|uniref:Uncharacterized protein n=1 Tax=Papaver somniferum TaxID=3469 RepID=A0A4Y7LE37_PAPSO|nr:hypothetical protein C5167_046549 [Papaver somniferum]
MAENTEMMKDLVNVDPLHLIDVCSEDDCLISTPGFGEENQNEDDCFDLFVVGDAEERGDGKDDCFDLSETGDPNTRDDGDGQGQMDQKETGGRSRKNGMCNLRKSLVWDSAFFTNDGVLDAEELSFISNGMRKAAPSTLPGIQEDVRRSAESSSTFNSTLDGDSLTRESFEVDFFEDVRASIQRSSKLPNVANANSKVIPGVAGLYFENLLLNAYLHKSISTPDHLKLMLELEVRRKGLGVAPKKAELAGRNKMKPVVASKRQSVNAKEAIVRPRLAARSGEPISSSLKPPKIAGRANPISAAPTKKTTFAPTRVKIDNNTQKTAPVTGKGQTAAVLKKPSLLSSSVTSRLAPSPKSSSDSPPTTKMKPSASCSSFTTSGSTSSDSTAKSPLKSLRSKPDSKNVAPVSKPTLKNPLRISSKARTDPENSRLTAYLNSIPKPKLPSNISPSSSIDGWSTESSSSTSTLTYGSKANAGISTPHRGSTNIGVNSPRGGSANAVGSCPRAGSANVSHTTPRKGPTNVGVDSPRKISSLRRESHASQASNVEIPPPSGKSPLNQGTKKASALSALVSNTASANGSKACKPSGLRMPSPKIGFFDAEKSLVSTPLGGSQSRSSARNGLTGSGESRPVTPSEELVNTKVNKLQEGRSVKPAGSIKLDSVVPSASSKKYASSEQLQELSLDSPKLPDASAKLQDNCDTASEVQKHPSSGTLQTEHCKSLDVGELPNIIPVDQGSVANEEKMDVQHSSENSTGVVSDVIVPSGEEETLVSEESFDGSMTPSKTSGEMPLDEQGHPRDSSDLLQKKNDKENLSCTDDQVDGLVKQVAAVDLNVEVIEEPIGKKDTHNGDAVVVSSNTCTLLDHDQEELEKISAKLNHLCLSPNTVEILYSTRAPLADNISLCNKSEPFESESESTVDASQSIAVASDIQN